jgi:putative restriction endonuclease
MTKAILTTKPSSNYDDRRDQRYHFPKTYLRVIEEAVGDTIIYYEPRRNSVDLSSRDGRMSYFAAARISSVRPDPATPDHYYADIIDYLDFTNPVPFKEGERYFESRLHHRDDRTNRGQFGRAVRPLPDAEYDLIMASGFQDVLTPDRPRVSPYGPGMAEEPATFERPIVERLTSRLFRDAAFSTTVKNAYANTCAITGLKIINGGGRSEVQAAHIRPVADMGTDSVRNGIALCGTVHWMFDRGLLSLGDDYSILTAGDKVPDTIQRLINPTRKLLLPGRADIRPHPQFLNFHRREVFKG